MNSAICKACNTNFTKPHFNSKYCSPECFEEGKKIVMKQYYKSEKGKIIREKDNKRKRERYAKDAKHRDEKREKTKIYHRENPDVNLKSRLKLLDDPDRLEKRRKIQKKYHLKNIEIYRATSKKHYKENKEYYYISKKKWYSKPENQEKSREHTKRWYHNGGKKKQRAYEYNRLKTDAAYRAGKNIRARLNEFIRLGKYRKYGTFREKLGCDWDFFKKYIEDQFYNHPITNEKMNWKNYGTCWHIDHAIPLSKWDLSKEEDQRLAAHYSNLQPMWAEQNQRKGNKL